LLLRRGLPRRWGSKSRLGRSPSLGGGHSPFFCKAKKKALHRRGKGFAQTQAEGKALTPAVRSSPGGWLRTTTQSTA
jgi:hypothetical protein